MLCYMYLPVSDMSIIWLLYRTVQRQILLIQMDCQLTEVDGHIMVVVVVVDVRPHHSSLAAFWYQSSFIVGLFVGNDYEFWKMADFD